ncbi:MAG: very-short-patch-repair endonuclease [bacterium]|jgi:very-short-patch-repair endonuclease
MTTKEVTVHEKKLFDALTAKGIFAELIHCDDFKCVDLCIPEIKLNIEIDGSNHYTDSEQILADILRDNYSEKDGFHTFRVPNESIDHHIDGVVKAITEIISRNKTLKKISSN